MRCLPQIPALIPAVFAATTSEIPLASHPLLAFECLRAVPACAAERV